MQHGRPNFFSGPYLERRAEEREDPEWVAAARADDATRYLIARGSTQLLLTGSAPGIAFLGNDDALLAASEPAQLVLLGWYQGRRCVLLELPPDARPVLPSGTGFEELRPLTALLAAQEAGLLAYARALSVWRTRARFCGVCGTPTRATHAGHCMRCTNPTCQHEYFPRLDPAIIVLVSDGERALLGR